MSEIELLQLLGGGGGGALLLGVGFFLRARLADLSERLREQERLLHEEQIARAKLEGRLPNEGWYAQVLSDLSAQAERIRGLGRSVDDMRERVVRIEASLSESHSE